MPPDDPNPNPNPNPGDDKSRAPAIQPQNQPTNKWGDTWRLDLAGGDAERAKSLERFTDPTKVFESYRALQSKVSSGELRTNAPRPTGDAATPEALKAWRQDRALPVEPTDIKVALPPGAKMEDLDEAGKARIDFFTKAFYDSDIPQSAVDTIMSRWNEFSQKEHQARAVEDAKLVDATEDALRAEWGSEYKSNVAIVDRFLQQAFGEDTADLIMGARTMDGRRLFNIPEVFKALNQLGRANGVDDVVTGETQLAGGKSVQARIDEIKQIMATDMARYRAEGLDVEYDKLLKKLHGANA